MWNEKNLINNMIDPLIPNTPEANPETSGLINPMEFDVRTKSYEEKIYIILYKINDDSAENGVYGIFSVCVGRTEAYNDIKEKLISGVDVDIHRSKIMTETKQTETATGNRKYYFIPYEECISVYSFCTTVKEFYSDDDFDIEDYNTTEVPDDPNSDLANHPMYLTPEQQEYRKMLEASMKRDKFISEMRRDMEAHNI